MSAPGISPIQPVEVADASGTAAAPQRPSAQRIARAVATAILLACAVVFVVRTMHWPLVGDPAIMHYVAFLAAHGMVPYRQIVEINLPGALLMDTVGLHAVGGGTLTWRVFDLLLLACATLAMMALARDWFVGLVAGVVLAAVHGADGVFNVGQRDFLIAVLVLLGYAALFRATRRDAPRWVFLFGLCAGAATTLKPTFLFLAPVVLVALTLVRRRQGREPSRFVGYGLAGWLIPFLAVLVYLMREQAVGAFLRIMTGVAAYHASLARMPLGFLLLHAVAPVGPLVIVWVALGTQHLKLRLSWERLALLIGLVYGLFSYLAQAKGYPYQRYPFLAILLLLMAMDFQAATRKSGWTRAAGSIGIACCVLWVAPLSVWQASRYDWRYTGMVAAIESDLTRLGGPALSGQVQCIDTAAGCYNALYDLRIVQHTGFLYDEFLFGDERSGAIAANRSAFWTSLTRNPPQVIVVVAGLFPSGPPGFQKLRLWPEFDGYLGSHYVLYDEVTPSRATYWWARKDPPRSYRIYLLKEHEPAISTR